MEKWFVAKSESEFRMPNKNTDDSENRLPAKFTIIGEAIIEKKVKPIRKSGRVYLPPDWVGKRVKIIRID